MDEYLFITMAKLKADRLRLEREQAHTTRTEPTAEPPTDEDCWSFAESTEPRQWKLSPQ